MVPPRCVVGEQAPDNPTSACSAQWLALVGWDIDPDPAIVSSTPPTLKELSKMPP